MFYINNKYKYMKNSIFAGFLPSFFHLDNRASVVAAIAASIVATAAVIYASTTFLTSVDNGFATIETESSSTK